jgi:hypothetical protein
MTILISPRWSDWYWIVNDTNKTTKVYSTASNAYMNNNAATFLTWLADANFGAASNLGSSVTISGAADNGSGKTRLRVESSANFATGQFFYFAGNGAQQITVIDGTHVDLTGLAFGSYVATAVMQGASIIDTDGNLRTHLNKVAYRSNAAGANSQTSLNADLTLTNPMALWQTIAFSVPGKKVVLPVMNAPNSVPIGVPLILENTGVYSYDIYYQDGVTKLTTVGGAMPTGTVEKVILELTDNSTSNGLLKILRIVPNPGIPSVHGVLIQNDLTTPNTKITVAIAGGGGWTQYINASGETAGLYQSFGYTIDAGLAGPVANGRDQAGAFSASQWLHLYAIYGHGQPSAGIVSTNGPDILPIAPTLPAGYTHAAYLTSIYWDASNHFVRIHQLDDRVSYDSRQVALNGGAATADTAVSVNTLVPSCAIDFDINIESWGVTADGTGAAISVLHLGYLSGTDTHQLVTDFAVSPSTATRLSTGDITFPNVSQQFYYHHQVLNGSGPAATITARSYRVPNGA